MRQIFLDTETTGLFAQTGDRIIEIGCVEMIGRKLTGNNFHHYLNPDRDSHEDALRVHGLTTDFLRDKPRFEDIIEAFLRYIEGADEIIIHNAAFDVGFLNKEMERLKRPAFSNCVNRVVDSLALAKEMFPGKRNGLDALCDRLEVDNSGRTLHGALLDAELLADVYINLTRGQEALLMEVGTERNTGTVVQVLDLTQFELPVVFANERELTAHHAAMQQVEKSSGGQAVWKN